MTAHADILDVRDPLRGALAGAISLHLAVFGALAIHGWVAGSSEAFGSPDAGGGAVSIEAVDTIPLIHKGAENPVANDTRSQVPQQPAKPEEREKKEVIPPDAVPLKSRNKKTLAQAASERQRFRPFEEIDQNQVFAKSAPQVSNPMYAVSGGGQIGAGPNTTLGVRFAGYGRQIQEMVARKWRTGDVDAQLRDAPVVIATFELLRNGSIRNLQVLQRSGNLSLDNSVQRAILDAGPFPPIPPGFEKDFARVEFWFELKR